jgi:hypothetical protein
MQPLPPGCSDFSDRKRNTAISTMMIESLRREGNDTTTQLLVARCANIELIIAATRQQSRINCCAEKDKQSFLNTSVRLSPIDSLAALLSRLDDYEP